MHLCLCGKIFNMKIFLYLIFLIALKCPAQQDLTLHGMTTIPQLKYTNPAFMPECKYYIGLPFISSWYFNFNNNGFVVSDLLKKRDDDSIYFDVDNMISKLSKNNYLSAARQIDYLSAGMKKNDEHYFFNITRKDFIRFSYPKDLIILLFKGNEAFIGKTANLEETGLHVSQYIEFGFGVAKNFNETLIIGAKIKYLFGISNISTKKSNISLYTAPGTYEITAKADVLLNTSGSVSNKLNSVSGKKINHGFSIDMEASYLINNKVNISASIIDLGFISWRENPKNYKIEDASFTFTGIDIFDFFDTTNTSDPIQSVIDSLKTTFEIEESSNAYNHTLIPRIYIGTSYLLNDNSDLSLLIQSEYFNKTLYPSLTIGYNRKIIDKVAVSINYSILNRSYNNIGLGFSMNLWPVQLYLVSDNIYYLFNLGMTSNFPGIDRNLIIPLKTKNAHVRFGVNLIFGRELKDFQLKKNKLIPRYKHEI